MEDVRVPVGTNRVEVWVSSPFWYAGLGVSESGEYMHIGQFFHRLIFRATQEASRERR